MSAKKVPLNNCLSCSALIQPWPCRVKNLAKMVAQSWAQARESRFCYKCLKGLVQEDSYWLSRNDSLRSALSSEIFGWKLRRVARQLQKEKLAIEAQRLKIEELRSQLEIQGQKLKEARELSLNICLQTPNTPTSA